MVQKFLSKLNDREKKILYITMAIVLLVLFERLFWTPASERVSGIDQEIAQQENIIIRDLKFLQHKDRIFREKEVFDKYVTSEVPDDDVVNSSFLSVVEQLATQSGVNLAKSNPTETVKKEGYSEFYANLDCTGTLKDIITFIHMLNSSDEMLKVVTLNMSPRRGEEEAVNASMTIVKLIVTGEKAASN